MVACSEHIASVTSFDPSALALRWPHLLLPSQEGIYLPPFGEKSEIIINKHNKKGLMRDAACTVRYSILFTVAVAVQQSTVTLARCSLPQYGQSETSMKW